MPLKAAALVVVLATLVAGCSSTAPRDAVHKPTGWIFPAQVGPFQREKVTRHDPAGDDVSCDYDAHTTDAQVAATVRIYPVPRGQTAGQQADAGAAVARQFARV